MNPILFGTVTGKYTIKREEALQKLQHVAEQVTKLKGVSWDIQLQEEGDQIRILGPEYVDSMQGTKVKDTSRTFTAEAGTRSSKVEQEAEDLLQILLGNQGGFQLDVDG